MLTHKEMERKARNIAAILGHMLEEGEGGFRANAALDEAQELIAALEAAPDGEPLAEGMGHGHTPQGKEGSPLVLHLHRRTRI